MVQTWEDHVAAELLDHALIKVLLGVSIDVGCSVAKIYYGDLVLVEDVILRLT